MARESARRHGYEMAPACAGVTMKRAAPFRPCRHSRASGNPPWSPGSTRGGAEKRVAHFTHKSPLSITCCLRPDYRAIVHFRQKRTTVCRPLSRNPRSFCQKTRSIIGHCVTSPFVFIHIPGGSFIFNISRPERPVSDPKKHIREPPQLAQAGIFHSLHERRA
jgi:hypothetical protein